MLPITEVTRVSRESIFIDLNNLSVVTTSTPLYQTCFGFTQAEVDAALSEFGLADKRQGVRDWYDGFVFDGVSSIYNPWSITQFLRYGTIRPNEVWALLLAAGYITSSGPVPEFPTKTPQPLRLTNAEVLETFDRMAQGWFAEG